MLSGVAKCVGFKAHLSPVQVMAYVAIHTQNCGSKSSSFIHLCNTHFIPSVSISPTENGTHFEYSLVVIIISELTPSNHQTSNINKMILKDVGVNIATILKNCVTLSGH